MQSSDFEEKWRKRWEEAAIFEANVDTSRPKIFVTFPYPYMNGPLHIGHGFTATKLDVYARFKRMEGNNTLFPWAWHWTGQPIVAAAERLAQGEAAMVREFREIDGVSEDVAMKFVDPAFMAEYYTQQGRETIEKLGFSVDWRREFHTTSLEPTFSKFIEWQYLRLKAEGYVTKGTHPVVWCPRDESPTGDHDRLEGEGISWEEYVLMKFEYDGAFLLAATFRPETIFGVTNLWINPEGEYMKIRVDGKETWVISRQAVTKLKAQKRGVDELEIIKGRELIGGTCRELVQGRKIPILPGSFVDTGQGSGVVYSVPAHAPFDYVALRDLQLGKVSGLEDMGVDHATIQAIQPISIITAEGFGDFPAKEVAEKMEIKDQNDPKCDEATKLVYKKEFHTGVLGTACGEYAGGKVSQVKERLIQDLKERHIVDVMYDLPEPVICRCKTSCIVKVIEGQWFLRYSDTDWKRRTHDLLSKAHVYPSGASNWFSDVIDWYRDWPCARRVGLGTPLPGAEDWIVETLSDSTVYMAFYTINLQIRTYQIPDSKLVPEVFDFVLQGRGEIESVVSKSGISRKIISEMRKEFLYWYPVDLRISAKELLPNHLTFFLFQHAALFPEELWPRTVGVNGMMMLEGAKMSKSKGNIITLRNAIDSYGADVVRATLISSAEGMDDADWRAKSAEDLRSKLGEFLRLITDLKRSGKDRPKNRIDRWLQSSLERRLGPISAALESHRTRTAFQLAFFDPWNDLKWYQRRVKDPCTVLVSEFLTKWIRLLSPFIPFTTEEANEIVIGEEKFISLASWPKVDDSLLDSEAEVVETMVVNLLEDARKILRLKIPQKKILTIFVAPQWQFEFLFDLADARIAEKNLNESLKALMERSELPASKQDIARAFQRLAKRINELGDETLGKLLDCSSLDEELAYKEAAEFIGKELDLEIIVKRADLPNIPDPTGRARNALPTKPALYLE